MASAWGSSWGSAWGNAWGSINTLIGKRPRRRGRSRPRFEELVALAEQGEVDLVAKEYAEQVIEQAQIVASTKVALSRAKSAKVTTERLIALDAEVQKAEERMKEIRDEEELIIILALAV